MAFRSEKGAGGWIPSDVTTREPRVPLRDFSTLFLKVSDMPTSPRSFRSQERKQQREQFRGNCVERGYDAHWMRISKMIRAQRPVCEMCNDAPSEDVDHIIPFNGLKDPLRTDVQNLMAICRRCHRAKTARQNR